MSIASPFRLIRLWGHHKNNVRKTFLLALVLGVALVGCGRDVSTSELLGQVIDSPTEKPSFILRDTDGIPFDFAAETDGVLTLLYFGYLNCPDICPVHLAQIAEVFDQDPPIGRQTKVVFVSVDPDRDSPEEVRAFLDNFDSRFIGLVGSQAELETAQDAVGIPHATKVGEGDDYAMNHAGWVIAYGPDNLNHAIYPFGTRQTQWANDLKVLVAIDAVQAP
jgi:protein SCO1/2